MDQNMVAREKNRELNFQEYITGKTFLRSFPKVLFVELTQNCNLNCLMCRASTTGYDENLNMDEEIFYRLKNELFPYASMVDLRGFGESTILPNFEDKIRETHSVGPKIRLVTNAVSIKKSIWKALMETGSSVVVSIDATKDELTRKIGRGSFQKLLSSLDFGCSERAKSSSTGRISINTTVSSLNLEELKNIILLAVQYNIELVTMFPVVATKDNPLHLSNRRDEIVKYLLEAADLAKSNNIELRLGASLDDNLVVEAGLPQKCSHPWEYCYIDYSGNVGYCDHLIGHSSLTLGNLKNESFVDIWNGTAFVEVRNFHNNARKGSENEILHSLPHCDWCYRRRYVDFENEFNYTAVDRIISTMSQHPILINATSTASASDFLRARNLPHAK